MISGVSVYLTNGFYLRQKQRQAAADAQAIRVSMYNLNKNKNSHVKINKGQTATTKKHRPK